MNAGSKKGLWLAAGGIVAATVIFAWSRSHQGSDAQQSLEDTRRTLRQEGFKTDLADFNITVDSAMRARSGLLTFLASRLEFKSGGDQPELLPRVADDTALVVWNQTSVKTERGTLQWSNLLAVLATNREPLDWACEAAASGPIRFDVDLGSYAVRWPHYPYSLYNLSLALDARTILELHEDHADAAWTNLLAATRLATAWQPDPTENAYIGHALMAANAFDLTWQALQKADWPDEKLAALQQEWGAADFFTNLPDTLEFDGARAEDVCRRLAHQPLFQNATLSDFLRLSFEDPRFAYREIQGNLALLRYRGYNALTDQKNLLLYSRDRAQELRRAIESPTWAAMRSQPGVTNAVAFKSSLASLSEFWQNYSRQENCLPARMAEVEVERRIVITALAVERYRGRHGGYPATLDALAPEFFKAVPLDFMDGQPLRYRLTDGGGHFVLYSVGLDCVDDGGKMPLSKQSWLSVDGNGFFLAPTDQDIVWPRPELEGR